MPFIAGELEFQDALNIDGVPIGMHHEIRLERIELVVCKDGAVDLGITLIARLDGEIATEFLRKALLDGSEVDPRIMRPSTSRILAAAMKQ